MLLRFTVANYASFRDEQVLSAVAFDAHEDIAVRAIPGSRELALPAVGVFGPNASGKSNIVRAMAFVSMAVQNSFQRWRPRGGVPRRPFMANAELNAEPSRFVVEFVSEEVRYEYGFTCNSELILTEWLYSFPKNRARKLFERESGKPVDFGSKLLGPKTQVEKIMQMRPNSLYLSAAAASDFEQLRPVYRWFERDFRIAVDGNFDARLTETRHFLEKHKSKAIINLLRYADLGVSDVMFSDVALPPERAARVRELLTVLNDDDSPVPEEVFSETEVEVSHRVGAGEFSLPLSDESSGTQTWLGIVGPIFTTLRAGSVLVIDELDARLHHHLAGQFVRLFQDPRTNPKRAQLIFNTHDAALMSSESISRLRRDQVWITEKRDGATYLVPLIAFKVRSIENIEKRYLNGRYGGLPFFDEELLADVIEEVSAPAWRESGDPSSATSLEIPNLNSSVS